MSAYAGANFNGDGEASMAVTVQPARELTEMERINLQINATTDASLDSTRRMVNYMTEAQQSGANTLNMLDEQGEKLNRTEAGLDKINADMKIAEQHVNKLERCCCCCCALPWEKSNNFESKPEYKATWENGGKNGEQNKSAAAAAAAAKVDAPQPYEGNYIQRVTNDAREDEMEDNVRMVAASLSVLKSQASTMGGELERQNDQLERMKGKTERNQERVDSANVRMAVIVGSK